MSEEKLREALKVALQARFLVRNSQEWDRAWGIVEDTLSEAGEPKMMRLLRWLDERSTDFAIMESKVAARNLKELYAPKVGKQIIQLIIEHIEREFGYKIPEGEE
jgi:hypothetical protein